MSDPLWRTLPNDYQKCFRCDGTGTRKCQGSGCRNGLVWGRIYGLAGLYRVSRRMGWKTCGLCHGRGTTRCSCVTGSVPRR